MSHKKWGFLFLSIIEGFCCNLFLLWHLRCKFFFVSEIYNYEEYRESKRYAASPSITPPWKPSWSWFGGWDWEDYTVMGVFFCWWLKERVIREIFLFLFYTPSLKIPRPFSFVFFDGFLKANHVNLGYNKTT